MKVERFWTLNFGTIEYKYVSKLVVTGFNESIDVGNYSCEFRVGSTFINSTDFNVCEAFGEFTENFHIQIKLKTIFPFRRQMKTLLDYQKNYKTALQILKVDIEIKLSGKFWY